jgi:hypothetical protein
MMQMHVQFYSYGPQRRRRICGYMNLRPVPVPMPVLLLRCSLLLLMPVCGAAATAWIERLNAVFADAHNCRNVAVLKLHFEFNARGQRPESFGRV